MPAAAVIPAPIAYIKVVAVKTLVVGFLSGTTGLASVSSHWFGTCHLLGERVRTSLCDLETLTFTLRK